MTPSEPQDLSSFSMLDLFRLEAENQTALLTDGLLALERERDDKGQLAELMRAAHSLKGAARMVSLDVAVRVTHAMEDCFVNAQKEQFDLTPGHIDVLLRGVDLLQRIAASPENDASEHKAQLQKEADDFLRDLAAPPGRTTPAQTAEAEIAEAETPEAEAVAPETQIPAATKSTVEAEIPTSEDAAETEVQEAHAEYSASGQSTSYSAPDHSAPEYSERDFSSPASRPSREASKQAVRVTPENLNRLLGLAGEAIVASRWLDGFSSDLLRLKQLQQTLSGSVQRMREFLSETELSEQAQNQLLDILEREANCREYLTERLAEFEVFDRRFINLSGRFYQEVLDCRMRPFGDVAQAFRRVVRDAARTLGKDVRLEIIGETTPVDRDILERIEAPLGHLLRNAVDHGIEAPDARRESGKPERGVVKLEARHSAGMLLVQVSDDGAGVDPAVVREAVLRKGLAGAEVAAKLDDAELMEFLFLPGFTMKENVTEISGRGVGLDVVQTLVKEVGGSVRISSSPGRGTTFQLQLPLTLSVIRTLLVEIAGEPYAFPLNRIGSTLRLPCDKIESVEGRQHFTHGDRQVGLVTAHQVLEMDETPLPGDELAVVIVGDATHCYGVVVDDFCGERELTVRALDPRLGKVQNISSAALTQDQAPVLIFDVDDLIRSIENLVSGQRLARVRRESDEGMEKTRKRVLVVDDSLTVRELERKLISGQGYEVEVAVDGMDAWNAVRIGHYDLVVTDVDMPRMDGIELVTLIKKDARLHSLPTMIVSYKDREEDRRRGLEAGADYYLTKGSFHDETLLQAVADLIGEANA